MENLKHTKEYAELEAKKVFLGTTHGGEEVDAFMYGYLHSIEETNVADLLEALINLKNTCEKYFAKDFDLTEAKNAINKATK